MTSSISAMLRQCGIFSALAVTSLLTMCQCAAAQQQNAAPIEQPDRTTAYVKSTLALADNTVATRDILYAEGAAADAHLTTLDVYAPRGAANLPVVIYVHGGGWSRGDKSEVGAQPKMFNENNVLLVSVNYRLSPEVKYPTHVNDIAAGIAWVRTNIARFGGDPTKLVVMGHSAGSHLASLVATHPAPLGKQGLKVSDLKGAISLDGSGFDLVERFSTGEPKVAASYARAFGPDQTVYADASPIRHVNAHGGTPPFLLTYVKPDSVNHTQAKAFAERITASGGRAELAYINGKDHSTLAADLGTERDTAGRQILDFVQSVTTP